MMIDDDVAAMSPASVWRILDEAGRMRGAAAPGSTKKRTGFEQPVAFSESRNELLIAVNIDFDVGQTRFYPVLLS